MSRDRAVQDRDVKRQDSCDIVADRGSGRELSRNVTSGTEMSRDTIAWNKSITDRVFKDIFVKDREVSPFVLFWDGEI